METKQIDFKKIESKWQKKWEKEKAFEVSENSKKKKYYVLEMYPYPSATGLHMGHAFNFTIADILARYMRMKGNNVLYPAGYDSFGLPAENAAIKAGVNPKDYTNKAIENFIRQQKALGFSYDWKRIIYSHDPEYYRWNQHFFLQFLKKGLAYRKKSSVNFCVKCNSVLANEQVHSGKCWRHSDTEVQIRNLEQWFIKTTNYAQELLDKVDTLDWPERIKAMQKNWIGRSEGSEIIFEIGKEKWPIFTTRADTLMGVTFLVISAQHPRLMELVNDKQKKEVESFLKKIKSTSEKDTVELEKEGVFTGSYAIHPITKEKVPVWAGNFVVTDYGSGMVMAVPAHDQRDFDFAKKYNIPIKLVITPDDQKILGIAESLSPEFYKKAEKIGKIMKKDGLVEIYTDNVDEIFELAKNNFVGNPWYIHCEGKIKRILFHSAKEDKIFDWDKDNKLAKDYGLRIGIKKEQLDYDNLREAHVGSGILVNSGDFNGLYWDEAKTHITKYLEGKKLGKFVVQFKLRDWLISRQRYWGTPIPVIHCEKCGIVPVNEDGLPVLLPEKVKFGEGNPLATNDKFVNVECPKCKGKARRETETMDTFFDSSWYYLRFSDSKNKKIPFEKKNAEYWLPIDFYTGGAEHACMHLIYARFFTKALRDLGFSKIDEPFKRLFNQGMVHGEDGKVMSKSAGNGIDPLEVSNKYGADVLRFFLVNVASPDKDFVWSTTGVESVSKVISKIYSLKDIKFGKSSKKFEHKLNKTIKEIDKDMEYIQYNQSIIRIRALIESFEEEVSKEDFSKFVRLIAPFCPHVAEELWAETKEKGFVSLAEWPKVDEKKIDLKLEEEEKNIDKTVSDILNILKIVKEKQSIEAQKIFLYVLPNEFNLYDSKILTKRSGKEVTVFKVNDPKKYDPQGKASKAKPTKPAIYVE